MFKRILLPLDGSAWAEAALPHALALAQMADAELILLHVIEERAGARSVDPFEGHLRQAAAQSYLAQTCRQLRACGVRTEMLLDAGSPAERIAEQAEQLEVDLILMSSHGQSGQTDASLGSVAHTLMEHIGVSCMLVRVRAAPGGAPDWAPARYRTILVLLDGSRRAECVLPLANRLAAMQGAELVLAHVVHRPSILSWAMLRREDHALAQQLMSLNQAIAERYLIQLQERQDVHTTRALAEADNVAMALYRMAEQYQAELVVASAHGAGANPLRLFGDTLTNILAYCGQPVLVYQDRPRPQASRPQAAPPPERAHDPAWYR